MRIALWCILVMANPLPSVPSTVMVNCVRDHKEFREYPFHKAMVVAVWNGEETGQTFVAKDRADPGWITAGRAGEVFNFSVPKGTLLKQCELDLQLWVTNVNGGRGKYLGSAIFSAYELEALVGLLPPLEGETEPVYRKHAIVCKAPLVTSHSPTIPRVNRSPIGVQGNYHLSRGKSQVICTGVYHSPARAC